TVAVPESTEVPEPAPAPPDPQPHDVDQAPSTATNAAAGPSPPIDRTTETRGTRERIARGRRRDLPRRPRPVAGLPESASDPEANAPPFADSELPSVRDILVNHRNSPGPRPAVERGRRGQQAIPTVPREPGQWTVPGWLALPPVGAFMLGMGIL